MIFMITMPFPIRQKKNAGYYFVQYIKLYTKRAKEENVCRLLKTL